jgi:APA family basic amino acid/polyamine antiporter
MAFSAATIFIIRKKTKHLDKSQIYTMRFFPLMPIIFISAYLFVAISITIDKPQTALIGSAVLAAFLVLFFVTKKSRRTSEH